MLTVIGMLNSAKGAMLIKNWGALLEVVGINAWRLGVEDEVGQRPQVVDINGPTATEKVEEGIEPSFHVLYKDATL